MEDSGCHYTHVRDLGAGNFGVAKLMRNTETYELVAVKFIERGDKARMAESMGIPAAVVINQYVEREILNHIQLSGHPNIIRFKEVYLTPTHLCIAMEFAAGGELFEYIQRSRRLSEDHARYFFQQLICGVAWCHGHGVCHRDLKLENTLLDGGASPRLKICDFGYSKSVADSQPKSTVGTPAYIAPEVLLGAAYSGEAVDVWSCGVLLYVMLAGAYPFSDPRDPGSFRAMIKRILAVRYTVPPDVHFSALCADLLARIFVADPAKRIPLAKILRHPWFLHNLPEELQDGGAAAYRAATLTMTQSFQQVQAIIAEARTVPRQTGGSDAPTRPAANPVHRLG